MRQNIAKLMVVVLAVILVAGGLMGCNTQNLVQGDWRGLAMEGLNSNDSAKTVLKEPSGLGFEAGFEARQYIGGVQLAYKSAYSMFDLNSVALDFYYGIGRADVRWADYSDYEDVCVALYFYDGRYYDTSESCKLVGNYKEIDGYFFIKELSFSEITSGGYVYTISPNVYHYPAKSVGNDLIEVEYSTAHATGFVEFNHSETIVVPAKVFEREKGAFVFQISIVQFSKSTNNYRLVDRRPIVIGYEYVDDQTIQLSKSETTLPR